MLKKKQPQSSDRFKKTKKNNKRKHDSSDKRVPNIAVSLFVFYNDPPIILLQRLVVILAIELIKGFCFH